LIYRSVSAHKATDLPHGKDQVTSPREAVGKPDHNRVSFSRFQTGKTGGRVIILYGIPNCDTIRKARRWLAEAGIEYHFHDYRRDGLERATLQQWAGELGWENLLNRRGTTWRQLDEQQRASIDAEQAITLMLAQPALIKRPLLDTGKTRLLGFSSEQYRNELL